MGRDRAANRDPLQYRSPTTRDRTGAGDRSYARRGVQRPRDPGRVYARRWQGGSNPPGYTQGRSGFRMREPERGVIRSPESRSGRLIYPGRTYEPQRGVVRQPDWGAGRETQREVIRQPQREEGRQPARADGGRAWGGRSGQPPARGGADAGGREEGGRGRH